MPCRLNSRKIFEPIARVAKLWNPLPKDIVQVKIINSFKTGTVMIKSWRMCMVGSYIMLSLIANTYVYPAVVIVYILYALIVMTSKQNFIIKQHA